MTRDELEAVVRHQISAVRSRRALPLPDITIVMNQAVDAILTAADAYMVAEGGLTAERRHQLAEATAPKRGPR